MIDDLVKRAKIASEEYLKLDQKTVDNITKAMSMAGLEHHMELAKMAVEETGRGIYEDKITKNMFATEYIYHSIKHEKTVGIIKENEEEGYVEIAEPVGIIAGVTPVTNPTSTTMFKSIISAKTRNVIIFGFHPSAQKCSSKSSRNSERCGSKSRSSKRLHFMDRRTKYLSNKITNEPSRSQFNFGNRWNRNGKISIFLWKTSIRCWTRKCTMLY